VAQGVLVTQENIKSMHSKIVFAALLLLIVVSCKTGHKATSTINDTYTEKVLSLEDRRKFDYFYLEAKRLQALGELEKSYNMLKECLKIDEYSAATYFEIGNLYIKIDNIDNAIINFNKAFEINPQNDWYGLYLGILLTNNQKLDEAAVVYKKLIDNFPDKAEFKYRYALVLTQQKKFYEAIDVYNLIEKQVGISEAISLEKNNLYSQAGDAKSAVKEIINLKNDNPEQARYRVLLGDAYVGVKDFKKALKEYNKALELNPDYGLTHLSLAGYYDVLDKPVESMSELVKGFKSNNVPLESKVSILVQYMIQATRDTTKREGVQYLVNVLEEVHPDEADVYYYHANYLLSGGYKTEAYPLLERVVELDPDRYDSWLQMIGFHFDSLDWKSIIDVSTRTIDAHPQMPEAYLYKGIAAFQMKDYSTALNSFVKGAIFSGENKDMKGQFYANMGDTYYKLGDKVNAFDSYEKALELDDHNVAVLNNYAYYLSLEEENLSKAERMSAKTIELEPGNSTFLDTYAWVLFKQKSYSLAKFYIEKAIANIDEDNSEIFEHYGDILYMTNDTDNAVIYWQKALDAGSESESLQQKINSKSLKLE
jgi:tetratricopeptide (TPR) repeat protein